MKKINVRLSRVLCTAILPAAILLFSSVLSIGDQKENAQKSLQSDAVKPPKVVVEPQNNSPLTMSLKKNILTDSKEPQIELLIKNISSKAIRTYAIRYEIQFEVLSTEGGILTNIHEIKKTFQPNESRLEIINALPSSETPVRKVEFAIDYVEFVDDSFWGQDVNQFAEYLKGQRAGANYESINLLKLTNSKGDLAVKASLTSGKEVVSITESHSPIWLRGFSDGRDFIRARLQHKLDAGEVFDLKSELQKPFDASRKE